MLRSRASCHCCIHRCLRLCAGAGPVSKPAMRIVVPYAPGGVPDTVAALGRGQAQARIGQSVVVENRAGGNGSMAASRHVGRAGGWLHADGDR